MSAPVRVIKLRHNSLSASTEDVSPNIPIPKKLNLIHLPDPTPLDQEPPTIVRAIFTTDLNIFKIHEAIWTRIRCLLGQVPGMERQIRELESRLQSSDLTLVDRQALQKDLDSLRAEIRDLVTGSRWEAYRTSAEPLLDAYYPLSSNESKGIVSLSRSAPITVDEKIVTTRVSLINQYLDIARNYIELDITWQGVGVARCPGCDQAFSEIPVEEESGSHVCDCGYSRDALSKITSYKDSARVNSSNRNNYNDRETFIRGLQAYEGRSPDKIPEALYAALDAYFVSRGFPSGEYIRSLDFLPNGKKPGTSTQLLIQGLRETDNAAYYKNWNIIGHTYWGWRLPDLSLIRDQIIKDYDLTQPKYEQIKTRDSSLNINIRIYLHLRGRGFPCDAEDFKFLTQRESLMYHHNCWEKMVAGTDIKFTPLI